MKARLRATFVVVTHSILAIVGITTASATTTDASALTQAGIASSTMQAGPSVEYFGLVRADGAITFTPTFTVHVPVMARACHLPSDLPPNTTVIGKDTVLYNGPGNLGYDIVTRLQVCTSILVQARYGDFLKVETLIAGQTKLGFVHKSDLLFIPDNLPILSSDQVPWQSHDLIAHFSIHPDVIIQGSDVIVDNSNYGGFADYLPLSRTLDAGFKLTFQLATSDSQYGSIKLANRPNIN